MLRALALVMCASVAGPAFSDVYILGAGTVSCGQWLEYRAERSAEGEEQWVYGFLSGSKYYTDEAKTRRIDAAAINAFVDGYCRNNPLHPVFLAAAALVQEAGGPKAKHEWKR
jgi:hypothetical protein